MWLAQCRGSPTTSMQLWWNFNRIMNFVIYIVQHVMHSNWSFECRCRTISSQISQYSKRNRAELYHHKFRNIQKGIELHFRTEFSRHMILSIYIETFLWSYGGVQLILTTCGISSYAWINSLKISNHTV